MRHFARIAPLASDRAGRWPMAGELRLVGRQPEQAAIVDLLAGAQHHGASLVIHGPAGLGKSALLDFARSQAGEQLQVISASGTPAESALPLGALHQMLRPVLRFATGLAPRHRSILNAAFGITDDPAPEYYSTALAVLDLLAEVAEGHPLLVLADDVQWMDDTTELVLAFVARRIESDRIALIATTRHGGSGPLHDSVTARIDLQPLDAEQARELLSRAYPTLPRADKATVLSAASGNPLALLELPKSLEGRTASRSGAPPLTERLERSFAARADELGQETRTLLDVAAISDSGSVGEIVDAADRLAGRVHSADDLDAAAEVGLIVLGRGTVRIRSSDRRSIRGSPQRGAGRFTPRLPRYSGMIRSVASGIGLQLSAVMTTSSPRNSRTLRTGPSVGARSPPQSMRLSWRQS